MGNKNSGRRPRAEEERKLLGRLFPRAVGVLQEILDNPLSQDSDRLRASQIAIEQHIGKPTTRVELPGDGALLLRWVESPRVVATENVPLLEGPDADRPSED